ncbi:MAG: RICIN domain-containing protein [Patescibacteria group bacterium]|nr:RICIN domain-containing protein [Patescibacteria group bacterium]
MTLTLLLCAMLGHGDAGGGTADLQPVPSLTALVEARKLVEDVYGARMAAAKTAEQKAAVAEEILAIAEKETNPANRYAGFQAVKRLAIDAEDGRLGLAVVKRFAAEFQPTLPREPNAWLPAADKAWEDAESKKGSERLAGRLDAAECYFRAGEQVQAGFAGAKWKGRIAELEGGGAAVVAAKVRPPLKLSPRAMKAIHSLNGATVAFVNRANGMTINVASWSKRPGAKVVQYPLPLEQRESSSWWTVSAVEGGYCRFKNQISGQWLTVIEDGESKRATQGVDHATANDWELRFVDGLFLLIHADSGLCLGPLEGRTQRGELIAALPVDLAAAHLLWGIRLLPSP